MHYYNKINIKPENMKKLWIIGTAVILTLCTSCNRDVREHTGDYSYKLSRSEEHTSELQSRT